MSAPKHIIIRISHDPDEDYGGWHANADLDDGGAIVGGTFEAGAESPIAAVEKVIKWAAYRRYEVDALQGIDVTVTRIEGAS